MVIVISENFDYSTDKVLEWLQTNDECNVLRLNTEDTLIFENIFLDVETTEICLKCDKIVQIRLSEVDFLWYRRGALSVRSNLSMPNLCINKPKNLNRFLNWESSIIENYILQLLHKKKSLGNYYKSVVNKLINLEVARECGLIIPATFISGETQQLEQFSDNHAVITKPISEVVKVGDSDEYINPLTIDVDPQTDLTLTEDEKFPLLLQSKIDKWIEIRVFIMYEELYSMAIFSQNNDQTRTDFRDYDYDMMNRMVPYNLPDEIEMKILRFMEKAGLDTGSMDLILSKTGEYVFLEVNPAGNIEMVSDSCNYHIEKRIAERIIKEINNESRPN